MTKDLRFKKGFTPLESVGSQVGHGKKIFKKRNGPNVSDSFLTGFTLAEILVVLAILSALASFGYLVTIDFYKSYAFNCERNAVVAILQKARSQSLANINESAHGVHFFPDGYIIFQGDVYSSEASTNQIFPAAAGIANSGITDVIFAQLSGDAIPDGNLILNDGKRTAAISVNAAGQINW
jgi:prepilin-type N-terminal cleavage/methylation domain-containing protein